MGELTDAALPLESEPSLVIRVDDGGETRRCVDCRAAYYFSTEERRRFERRGFSPPTWCFKCREQRSY